MPEPHIVVYLHRERSPGMAKLRVINFEFEFEFEFELHIFNPFFALRCLTLQRFNPLHAFTVNSRQEHVRSHTYIIAQ